MTWCRDEDEHRRQAEDDYRRGGRYGYDREEYRNPWNDCSDAYTREFDRRIRDDERRQEERDEERRAEARAAERVRERLEEEAYFQQAYEQQYPEQVYPEPEYPDELASAPEGVCGKPLGGIGYCANKRPCSIHPVASAPEGEK